jgi:hypothetical protein
MKRERKEKKEKMRKRSGESSENGNSESVKVWKCGRKETMLNVEF